MCVFSLFVRCFSFCVFFFFIFFKFQWPVIYTFMYTIHVFTLWHGLFSCYKKGLEIKKNIYRKVVKKIITKIKLNSWKVMEHVFNCFRSCQCLTCTFRASCCSACLSRAHIPAFTSSTVQDREKSHWSWARARSHWIWLSLALCIQSVDNPRNGTIYTVLTSRACQTRNSTIWTSGMRVFHWHEPLSTNARFHNSIRFESLKNNK